VQFQPGADGLVRTCFAVADTGIGIAPELQPHLFDAFRQGDQRNSGRFGGLGLGLTVSRDLVTAMGGRIEVNSQPGVGTTVRVVLSLPRANPPGDEPAVTPLEPLAADSTCLLRVLVVDDNQTNRHVARRLLEKLGCQVELASGGDEAVDLVAASH